MSHLSIVDSELNNLLGVGKGFAFNKREEEKGTFPFRLVLKAQIKVKARIYCESWQSKKFVCSKPLIHFESLLNWPLSVAN